MAALSSCHQVLMKKGQKVVLNPGSPGHYATWTTTSPPRIPPCTTSTGQRCPPWFEPKARVLKSSTHRDRSIPQPDSCESKIANMMEYESSEFFAR